MNAKAVDVCLAEFQSLRDEIFSRFEFQRQAFNYLMALFAAIVALVATDKVVRLDERFALFVPLLSAPLSFIFFDNEIVIWSIGRYINEELRPRLAQYCETEVLLSEPRRHHYFRSRTGTLHFTLSVGRWLLFFVPTFAPVALSLERGWLQGSFLFVLLFAVDLVLNGVFIWAVLAAIRMRHQGWSIGR